MQTALSLLALTLAAGVHLSVVARASRRLGPASMVAMRFGPGGPEDHLPWKVQRPLFVLAGLVVPAISAARVVRGSPDGAWEVAGAVLVTLVVAIVEAWLFRSAAADQER